MSRKVKPRLGQNFLVDPQAQQRIAEALGDTSDRAVVEIGPGHGAITTLLAARCRRLHLVELDPALARELTFRFRNDSHVTVHNADILETDLADLLAGEGSADVIGNLPYYITSDILLKLFSEAPRAHLRRAVLMMQREVADRVSAQPGVREFGMLSATAQLYADVASLFTLPPSSFSPSPDVYSTVLRFDFAPHFRKLAVDPTAFQSFLRIAFAQKRKTLSNNLRAAGYTQPVIEAAWPSLITPQARAESLGLPELAGIFHALPPDPA